MEMDTESEKNTVTFDFLYLFLNNEMNLFAIFKNFNTQKQKSMAILVIKLVIEFK